MHITQSHPVTAFCEEDFSVVKFLPMNPFSLGSSSYDPHLTDILARLGKNTGHTKPLTELLDYLSNEHSQVEITATKIALKPLLASSNCTTKGLVNQIIYRMLCLTSQKQLQSLQCEWMYHNIGHTEEYASKILKEYFTIPPVEEAFYKRIRWEDPIHDLSCFLYLIERSNGEYAFDPQMLELNTDHYFNKIYQILQVVKRRSSAKRLEKLELSIEDKASRAHTNFEDLFTSLFYKIRSTTDPIFINQKYRILLDLYNFVDLSIYNEAASLTEENLRKIVDAPAASFFAGDNLLIDKSIDFDRLSIKTIGQLRIIYAEIGDKEAFLLKNMTARMNVVDICVEFELPAAFIVKNAERLMESIGNSVRDIYRRRRLSERQRMQHGEAQNEPADSVTGKEDKILEDLLRVCTGKNKIIAARLCGKPLDPEEFTLQEIESVFECSVLTFPKSFFLSRPFSVSCLPLLEAQECRIEDVLPLYKNTKLEEALPFIENRELLKATILGLSEQEALRKFDALSGQITGRTSSSKNEQSGNAPTKIFRDRQFAWLSFYYLLRDRIPCPPLNFKVIFEHFFSLEFLVYLMKNSEGRKILFLAALDYVKDLKIENTVYFTGYNFDDQKEFFQDLKEPTVDPAISLLHQLYKPVTRNAAEDILFLMLSVILYQNPVINDLSQIKTYLKREEHIKLFGMMGRNSFIFERIRRQICNEPAMEMPPGARLSSHEKAVDVDLRSNSLPADVFGERLRFDSNTVVGVNATYLSPETLGVAIDFIMKRTVTGNDSEQKPDREYFPSCISLIESDKLLMNKTWRAERLKIYRPLIESAACQIIQTMQACYSFSKLETNRDDDSVFSLLIGCFHGMTFSFWNVLVEAIYMLNDIYLSLFVEEMIIRFIRQNDSSSSQLQKIENDLSNRLAIQTYIELSDKEELGRFAFVFPSLCKELQVDGVFSIEKLVKEQTSKKIENSRIVFSKGAGSCSLKMSYVFDSVSYTATIFIPDNFPKKMPRIDFDYKSAKCPKFYLKLNELLRKTTKFSEIFLSWKVNLDNRFAGYKECLICYYILEPKTRTFADFACQNCNNKFHKKCIFEWVRTGRDRLCPLCRVEMSVWE